MSGLLRGRYRQPVVPTSPICVNEIAAQPRCQPRSLTQNGVHRPGGGVAPDDVPDQLDTSGNRLHQQA
jgi:hypothetical protein